MKNKKTIMMVVVVLLLVIVSVIGASYAYFATVNKTTGNDKNLNIVTEDLGNIKWEGTKVYTSGDLLPGECGIQTFTIEKNSASGKGIYEIDLKGVIADEFGDDVEITLYKSTDTATNNVTIKEGSSTISGDTTKQYYKEDSVVLNGTPEKVYGTKALQNKDKIILEQRDFDNNALQKTTYYLVYCYKNNGNQDAQQGKTFSGEISVRLILEKGKDKSKVIDSICKNDSDSASCSVAKLANTNSDTVVLDDFDNIRYIGKDPNNYVSFDGDIWRIIGVMKDVDDGTGNKEDRVKIIRSTSIGNYSWDTIESSINGGFGVNEWSQADLMKLLNPGYESESVGGSLYWNNKSGTCYNDSKNTTTSCDFTNTGIKEKLKNMLGNAVWNTGSPGDAVWIFSSEGLAKHFYTYERSENTGKTCTSGTYCTDTVARTTTWTGKIGLMYPSDYGYATSGGSGVDRATCLNKELCEWYYNDANTVDCVNNDWLINFDYSQYYSQWTLSPVDDGISGYRMFYVAYSGDVHDSDAYENLGVRPVGYLLPSVKISSGTGSESDPFTLEN